MQTITVQVNLKSYILSYLVQDCYESLINCYQIYINCYHHRITVRLRTVTKLFLHILNYKNIVTHIQQYKKYAKTILGGSKKCTTLQPSRLKAYLYSFPIVGYMSKLINEIMFKVAKYYCFLINIIIIRTYFI